MSITQILHEKWAYWTPWTPCDICIYQVEVFFHKYHGELSYCCTDKPYVVQMDHDLLQQRNSMMHVLMIWVQMLWQMHIRSTSSSSFRCKKAPQTQRASSLLVRHCSSNSKPTPHISTWHASADDNHRRANGSVDIPGGVQERRSLQQHQGRDPEPHEGAPHSCGRSSNHTAIKLTEATLKSGSAARLYMLPHCSVHWCDFYSWRCHPNELNVGSGLPV
jgi:hypothetical protein